MSIFLSGLDLRQADSLLYAERGLILMLYSWDQGALASAVLYSRAPYSQCPVWKWLIFPAGPLVHDGRPCHIDVIAFSSFHTATDIRTSPCLQ